MLRMLKWILAAALPLAFVAGCVAPQVVAPATFNQQLAYGYAALAAARDTTVQLLQRKQITVDDAKKVQAQADGVCTALDTAGVTAGAGDMTKADEQLRLALSLLTALEAQLKAKGG